MSNTDWLSSILKDFDTWCLCGNKECGLSENYKEAEQAILNHIDKAIGEDEEAEAPGAGFDHGYANGRNQLRAELRKKLGIKEGE